MSDSGGSGPDPNIGLAALRTADLGDKAFEWAKDYYTNELAPLQRQTTELNNQLTRQTMATSAAQEQRAAEQYQLSKENFQPVDQALAKSAMDFNAADFGERKATQAAANVELAFQQSESQLRADLARRGVTMNSGQAVALQRGSALARAAQVASATQQARDQADALGFARLKDASSVGRGLASDASSSVANSLNAATTASNINAATSNSARANANVVSQGAQTGIQGNTAAGNLWVQKSGQQAAADQNSSQEAGAALGAIAALAPLAMASDRSKKRNVERVDDAKARKAIDNEPVYGYDYKEGVGDTLHHVGPMAQDVARMTGGKQTQIDVGDQLGVQQGALRAVSKEVASFGKRLAAIERRIKG